MIRNIMRKIRLTFEMPYKSQVRKCESNLRCPHCGHSTRVLTRKELDKRKVELAKYKL